jgi:hypothetical protein
MSNQGDIERRAYEIYEARGVRTDTTGMTGCRPEREFSRRVVQTKPAKPSSTVSRRRRHELVAARP